MPVSSDAVASSLITAVQRDLSVWVRRAASALAWSCCHLLCHWLQDHLASMDDRGSWRTRVRHGHGAMTGESGAVIRICERALPLPVEVRPPRWPPRPGPASPPSWRAGSARRGMGGRARRCGRPSSGLRRRTVSSSKLRTRAPTTGMEAPDPGVVKADVTRGPPGCGTPHCGVGSSPTSPGGSRS
jgi:hypothetical protein